MTRHTQPTRNGSYGVDAPRVFALLGLLAAVCVTMAAIGAIESGSVLQFVPVLFMLTVAAFVAHTTLRGKFVAWAELIDQLALEGDEQILDLGCGRGAVLMMAAQRLTTGRAVGVDIWQASDQSNNSIDATRRNAVAEGVADRVELRTGDMTSLPFDDSSFDVVLSSLAIHNIRGRAGREKAISEAVRVLRPGGRLMIADVRGTQGHERQLAATGMHNVGRRRLGWQAWWGGPWAPTRLVTATKPATLAPSSSAARPASSIPVPERP